MKNATLFFLPFQVVYFGDSMHSDIYSASHYSNWETVLILEELREDQAMVRTKTESEPLEKKGKYEVRTICSDGMPPKHWIGFTYIQWKASAP